MLDTKATHGTLAAFPEDGPSSDKGWRSRIRTHLGNGGKSLPISRRSDAISIPMCPWVADCDRNDARPLNVAATHVLLRATGKAPRHAVQREYALPHKDVTVVVEGESEHIGLDIAPDHDAPSGMLAARHGLGGQRARAPGQSSCRAQAGSTRAWSESRSPASR
ncbi:hypothetical protein [Azohydromonas australica]|uniref:hypothetical protein n=1 Tax=Azohydromonas australica TaxID=364039 RepID=UPI0012EB1808|nr:hypothetical protein [Azohydromonas australica]